VNLVRFNMLEISDMALAMTIFEESVELLRSIQDRTPPEDAAERRVFDRKLEDDKDELYKKASDLFEGFTGVGVAKSPMRTECHLGHDPHPDQCCCVCVNLCDDMSHPHTDGGRVTNRRGWACVVGGTCSSGWPEHSIGCELFERRQRKLL
jgi:hypothetical protein